MTPYIKDKKSVLEELNVKEDAGLNDEQVAESVKTYGLNVLERAKRENIFKRIFHAATEKMILILIFAWLIALTVNIIRVSTGGGEFDYFEVFGVLVAIILSVTITVVMEGRSAKAFEALSKLNADTLVKVIRNSKPELLPQKEIAVGDIIIVETGDKIAADGRLIQSTSLYSDESALTGESAPVEKDADAVLENESTPVAERINMLYSGCFIRGGSGVMTVTAVGGKTEFGKIAAELSKKEKSTTPLQEKLGKLGKIITILGASVAALVFLIQLIKFIVIGQATLNNISEAFITSIVLIVAAVPEGLPTIVAVSLSINIIKMSRQNALVKKLVASETAGCINVICSDKTGTLTENKMTVINICTEGGNFAPDKLTDRSLLFNFCVNGTADIVEEGKQLKFIGNPTECALLTAAKKAGVNYNDLRKSADIAHVYSFSSETKNMTTIVKVGKNYEIYTKGSPEKILAMCSISAADRQSYEGQIMSYQEKANRVIGFAHKTVSSLPDFENREEIESGLTFDGFTAISDPLRGDVYAAVKECKRAGIELKMLTGDNIITATAIANELHILDGDGIAVEAKDLADLSDEEFSEKIKLVRVIARSTPIIKMRVVKALKAMGNVVAVTGDGINDAPAIKAADVGIAMGITGTEVSKEASDIVLLDDSFATIATSVKWGRGIYENFQRFIQFQLTVNLSSVIVVLMSIVLGMDSPFTAIQLLWINLIMDGPPALTLGLEPIRGDLMARDPTKRNASIVSKSMLSRILINGIFISAIFLFQQGFNFLGATKEQIPTVLFAVFALFQLFNSFNSRELGDTTIFKNIHKNKWFLIVIVLTFALQVVITQFGGAVFGTVPISAIMWLKIFGLTASIIVLSELTKLIIKLFKKVRSKKSLIKTDTEVK